MAETKDVLDELEDLAGAEGAPPEAPPEEQPGEITAEEAVPGEVPEGGPVIEISPEQLPQLTQLAQGDTVSLTIQEISEDGNTYKLVATGEAEAPGVVPGQGRNEVAEELIGDVGEV